MKARHKLSLVTLALLLSGCAGPLTAVPAIPARQLCEQISGNFSNAAQIDTLSPSVSRKPVRDGEWIDQQYGRFVTFSNPTFGSCSVFFEWRSPDRDGSVTRRRVWSFDTADQRVAMRFYSFRDESVFSNRDNWPLALAKLSPAQLVSYPLGCEILFEQVAPRAWRGRLNDMTCTTTAQRSGKEIALGAEIEVSPGKLVYREQGRYADGTLAFTVPGTASYIFLKE